jgi:hypothetical protein
MYKTIKKISAIILTIAMITTVLSVTLVVNAAEEEKVRVIVRNDVFSVEDGAPWDGVLVDEWVDIDEDSTMMSSVVAALDKNGYSQSGAESNYISEINGLSEFDGGWMSGWMGTLNDWFTNEGFAAFTVADGKLESGDEINIAYSCAYGSDIGGSWSNTDTSLASVDFSFGTLSQEFSSDVTEYTLTIPSNLNGIVVTPTAANKYYQVRTYKNDFTPTEDGTEYKRSAKIDVKEGDKIIIGVGNENWAGMNPTDGGTVYTFTIAYEKTEPILGDVDQNGILDISDVTLIQKFIASVETLTDEQQTLADFDNDGDITIIDATTIQKQLAGFYD